MLLVTRMVLSCLTGVLDSQTDRTKAMGSHQNEKLILEAQCVVIWSTLFRDKFPWAALADLEFTSNSQALCLSFFSAGTAGLQHTSTAHASLGLHTREQLKMDSRV